LTAWFGGSLPPSTKDQSVPASIPCGFQITFLIPLAAALVFGGTRSALATPIIVDEFTAGTADLNITAATPTTQIATDLETGLTGVLGGSRNLTIQKVVGTAGSTRNVTGLVDSAVGELLYISGNGVIGSMTLRYDANGSGLNVALDQASDMFKLVFVEGDYSATRTIPILMTLTASNGQAGTLSQTLAVEQSPVSLEFAVADFSNLAGMNLSTNLLKSIQLDFSPTATSADFTLGSIEIVPEPSTWALALVGIGVTGYSTWRRRTGRRFAQESVSGWNRPPLGRAESPCVRFMNLCLSIGAQPRKEFH
jgi:hypothetical protein